MAPKQDRVYARGRLNSTAPSARLVIGSDDEHPDYVPPGLPRKDEMHVQLDLREKGGVRRSQWLLIR